MKTCLCATNGSMMKFFNLPVAAPTYNQQHDSLH